MNLNEAFDIIDTYEKWCDTSCVCFQGNPPCSKCTSCPDEDLVQEARLFIDNKTVGDGTL